MRLEDLTRGLSAAAPVSGTESSAAVEIRGLAYDSRAVHAGDLFFCVSGFRSDGHAFAAQAVRDGAVALVLERPVELNVPQIRVASVRAAMAPMAARFYGDPGAELRVVGVTGTNGKTTTAYLLHALLEASGERCGLLGTVKSIVGGRERPVRRTTPEAIDLQADLRAMLDGGERACVMEVSSHALELGRSDAIPFAAAVFTNLTQDHLDFHHTMESYFQAKRRLFVPEHGPPPGVSVINVGDPYGRRLAQELDGARTFALDAAADYSATDISCGFDRARFTLHAPTGERRVTLPLPGRFNVANALGALAVVHSLGGDLDALVNRLERGVRVPGRFEPVEEGQDFAVLVDYAHTPDSLENVLRAAGELVVGQGRMGGRVICVFGAGGDRDRGKRPQMGEIAARLSNLVFVTSDNPRSEDPDLIIAEIMAGVEPAGRELVSGSDPAGAGGHESHVRVRPDRRVAIEDAVASAAPGDVLVIAGKGHEQGQELADGRKLPFDDVTVAREALRARATVAARAPGA
jgi:UDP-N-acetylmuramoyl-L-alanyl-D-glutamate--2,6-diaminopimelate ligase